MGRKIKFLDSRMYKRIKLRYIPIDRKNLSSNERYFTIEGKNIVKDSFSLTESINSGDEWRFGVADKSVLKIKLYLKDLDYVFSRGDIIEVFAQSSLTDDAPVWESTMLGSFEVDTIENNDNTSIYDFIAYSYGNDLSSDALNRIEMKKMNYYDDNEVSYDLPIDALALESLGYAFSGVAKNTNLEKTGSANKTILRFDRTSSGWKSLVIEFDYYDIGNIDDGWSKYKMYRPKVDFEDITYLTDLLLQRLSRYGVPCADILPYLTNAALISYSAFGGKYQSTIENHETSENYDSGLYSDNAIIVKPSSYVYGYQPHFMSMPDTTCIAIPTGYAIWEIQGTNFGIKRAVSRAGADTARNGIVECYSLNSLGGDITISNKNLDVYDGITTEDIINGYCEMRGIKLVNNRNYSYDFSYGIEYPFKAYDIKYDNSLLYPVHKGLNPSRTLYPTDGTNASIINVGREMIKTVKISAETEMNGYGAVVVPEMIQDADTFRTLLKMPASNQVDNTGATYDRVYDMYENAYIKVKGYNIDQIKSQLLSNGFWTRLTKIVDSPKCSLKCTGMPFIEVGELINVYVQDGDDYSFIPIIVKQRTMKGEQGITDDIESDQLQKQITKQTMRTEKYE